MIHAEISTYDLPGGLRIERVAQRDGAYKWAIRNQMNDCMNKDCEFECELSPSNRDDAFLERCRFGSAEEAYETWVRSK